MGGLSWDDAERRRLEDYVFGLTRRERPRVLVVPTAVADDFEATLRLFTQIGDRAQVSYLPFFPWPPSDLRQLALEQDAIYVTGGNTANALAIWRAHGVDKALKRAWESGVVVAGPSAGGMCWFDAGLTDSFGPGLAPLKDGLHFLKGSFCPHYDSESLRRPRYQEVVGAGHLPDGYAADDGVGLLFEGRDLTAVVASLPGASAFRVSRGRGNNVEEEPLRARVIRP
jgi:dipeptidase E